MTLPPHVSETSPPTATGGPGRRGARRLLASSIVRQNILYLVGIGVSGIGVLLAQAYAAHRLTQAGNGESTAVVAVLNLLYTTSFVVAAGVARQVAIAVAQGTPAPERWADLRHSTLRIGLYLGAAMIPVDFLLAFLLHLPHPEVLAATVVAGPLAAMAGTQRGYLQGARDFRRLALNLVLYGSTVVILSVVFLKVGLGSASVPIATVAGAAASASYPRHRGAHLSRSPGPPGRLIDYTVVAGAATAPVFNNIDVVAARHVLSPSAAGLYSGLSVMGKIIFYGTSSLTAVMYPRIAAATSASVRRRLLAQTMAVLGIVDAILVLVYWFFAPHLLRIVLGIKYLGDSKLLLLFAAGVAGLTFVNLFVYYGMGSRVRHFAMVPAIGVPALIAWLFTSPPELGSFVPRIASALLLLAVLEAVLILPAAFH